MKLKNRLHLRLRQDLAVLGLVVVAVLIGCASGGFEDDPILRLSAAESLEQGKLLMVAEKYMTAAKYLSHAFEVEPNSAIGREALLLVADAHYAHGGPDNMIKAEAKYRDFLNRFPTSDRAAYVQYQIGNSLSARLGTSRPGPEADSRSVGCLSRAPADLSNQ